MRFLRANLGDPVGLFLLHFKAYLPLAVTGLLVWRVVAGGHQVHDGLAAASGPVMFGYMICGAVFALAAVIRFVTHKRELAAETLFLAGLAILVALFIGPWTVS